MKYSKWIDKAFYIRNNADYIDFYIATKEDALEQIQHAEEFVRFVQNYLKSKYEFYES